MKEQEFSPLGVLEEHILIAVHRSREAYGMEVRREIERLTGRDLAIGAVYATLDRLEAKGFVASRRVVEAGGSRRMFSLNQAGARALTQTHAMREQLWHGVDLRRLSVLAR